MTTLKQGSKGELVAAVQCILGMPIKQVDGKYGAATLKLVKAYKVAHGLPKNGKIGEGMWRAMLAEAPMIRQDDTGNYVRALECLLNLTLDGVYSTTEAARLQTYQAAQGLVADAVVGPQTWRALLGIPDVKHNKVTATPTVTPKRPKDYKQYDSKWGYKAFTIRPGNGQTMRSSGCGPTAMANIVATWCSPSVTPYDLALKFVAKGFRTANSGTAWAAFKWTFQQYPQFSKFIQTASHATAIAALAQGALVVASMGPGYWTKAGHFITLWQCDGTYMYACDPASSTRKKQALAAFKGQVKQYFIFWPVVA